MQTSDPDECPAAKPHLEKALTTSTDPEVRFHLRQALQYMTD